jgi:phospholipid transport system substrate-binding protein
MGTIAAAAWTRWARDGRWKPTVWRREHDLVQMLRLAIAGLVALAAIAGSAMAQEGPPQAVVERLNGSLLEVMQEADRLGYEGRYERLEPVLAETFDFPFMAKVAVGRRWNELSEAQREQIVGLFSQMSVANFAARFDGYGGERFEIVGEQPGPREAVLVESRILRPEEPPVGLDYLLQPSDSGEWRIIDVFLDSKFSELARQRSEFSSVLSSEGYDGLVTSLEHKIETLSGSG